MTTKPQKILLIQLRRLGDVLMTTPAIRQLRQALPEAELVFLTETPSDQLLQCNPHLQQVWTLSPKARISQTLSFVQKLRAHRFDCVIDFFGNPRSALLSWLSGAPQRIGFAFRGRTWAYSTSLPLKTEEGDYAAMHKLLLLKGLGIASQPDYWPEFPVADSAREFARDLLQRLGVKSDERVVSLSPVSRQPYKRWSTEQFARLADWLIECYQVRLLFIYGPGEQGFVDEVRQAMRQEALPNYDPPTLSETRALFEQVVLHVGNDNGPAHFAIAAGTPTVAIFGRPLAVNWTPPNQTRHLSVEFDPGCKSTCHYPQCGLECLGVSLEQVQEAIQQQLDRP